MSKPTRPCRIYEISGFEWEGEPPAVDDDGDEFPDKMYVNVPRAVLDPYKFVAMFLSEELDITPIAFRLKEETIH